MGNSKKQKETGRLTKTKREKEWQVILRNCYCHFFEEVVLQITKATGCSELTARKYAQAAEQFGSVAVYHGSAKACEKIAGVLGEIGLNVEVV